MKRLLIGIGSILVLTFVAPITMAQRGGAGSGRSAGNAVQVQTRARMGNQGRNQNSVGLQTQSNTRSGNQGLSQAQRGNSSRQSNGNLSVNTSDTDLLRMREEEKLARDVYIQLAKTSQLPIFQNISRAESQHMQALERLSPGSRSSGQNDAPGSFVFPEYQKLYDSLIASGARSPLDALKVGAKIEEMDIADLRRRLAETTDPQVQKVLERLMRGSENHLRAFASQIANQGASYNAEFLSQTDFDQIANSSGSGQGNGQQSTRGRNGSGGNGSGRGAQNRGSALQPGLQNQNFRSQGISGQGLSAQKQGGVIRGGRGSGRAR
ncbi:DUF2202 domain-containing protein [Aureliella helgolandensis]|uniref:DUF2202 domain-containing protein n=1 Tax=Aureliella helgolandensis TaxID=2527968 RepID=A0A518G7T3_9BACT|nr:DUF2202 domain-containing protein [Aureliella helgolandensis]QDV24645.1 hypothetical protein Q31a_29650 [Aureliella helgolandensis]